jgi:hypothetical protein
MIGELYLGSIGAVLWSEDIMRVEVEYLLSARGDCYQSFENSPYAEIASQ